MSHPLGDSAVVLLLEPAASMASASITSQASGILTGVETSSLSLCKQHPKSKMIVPNEETTIQEHMAKIPKYSFSIDEAMNGGGVAPVSFCGHRVDLKSY